MAARAYQYSWDHIAVLDCDHMAGWGAFVPERMETVEFNDDELPRLAFKMDDHGNAFSVAYQWPDGTPTNTLEFIQSRVEVARRPCNFGGIRAYFKCPCCERTTLRLAVLPEGLRCGKCGGVTWESRRQRPLQRLMRKADRIAWQLGCDSWRDLPHKRPSHMRVATFERLRSQRADLVDEINTEVARRLAQTRGGLLGQLQALTKMGV